VAQGSPWAVSKKGATTTIGLLALHAVRTALGTIARAGFLSALLTR
jgi:hypothetical protein